MKEHTHSHTPQEGGGESGNIGQVFRGRRVVECFETFFVNRSIVQKKSPPKNLLTGKLNGNSH
jgi:hypothetical protein